MFEITTSIEHMPSLSNIENNSSYKAIKEDITTLNTGLVDIILLVNNQSLGKRKNEEPFLKYDKKSNNNFSEIYSSLEKFIKNNENDNLDNTSSHTILLFKSIKTIVENENNTEDALKYLSNFFLLNKEEEVFAPYKNFFFLIESNNLSDKIIEFKNQYNNKSFNYQLEVFENNNGKYLDKSLSDILCNPLSCIHYLEYSIDLCNNFINDLSSQNVCNAIYQYNKCVNIIILYFSLEYAYNKMELIQFHDIFTTFAKGIISLMIELLLKNVKGNIIGIELIKNLLKSLLVIGFELELPEQINSNEMFIFALLGILIIIIKFGKEEISVITNIFSKITLKNSTLQSNEINLSNIDELYILIIKNIDSILMKKYNKDINSTHTSISNTNVDDFIISDMFIYTNSYDILKKSIKNFKEKLYWNFTEMCNIVLNKKLQFPKIFKMILMRHLTYVPDNKSLIYNLIQYYYKNQNFRKAKILCDKILSSIEVNINSIDKNSIQFEIETIVLFIYIHILIKEEKYNEAKNLAILNLERLNEGCPNKSLKYKSQMYLGICYNKLGEISLNHDEKKKNFDLAKYYFETSSKNYQNENLKYYIIAQNFMLKKFEEVDNALKNNFNSENDLRYISLNIINLITQMKYEEGIQLCIQTLKNFQGKKNIIYLNKIYFEYFYLKIYKTLVLEDNNNEDTTKKNQTIEKILIEMSDVLNLLNLEIKRQIQEIKKNARNKNNKLDESDNSKIQKLIIKAFQKNENKELNFSNESKSSYKYTSNYLLSIQIEIIKNFYLLTYYIYRNNYDVSTLSKNLIQITSEEDFFLKEEQNDIIISSIQKILEGDNIESENLLKKLFVIAPYNMNGLKILTQLLLNKKNFSDAYIFCLKGLKIDEKENDLWKMLSEYYMNNNDMTKYYQCTMKEIENKKYHINKFLEDLIDKNFI